MATELGRDETCFESHSEFRDFLWRSGDVDLLGELSIGEEVYDVNAFTHRDELMSITTRPIHFGNFEDRELWLPCSSNEEPDAFMIHFHTTSPALKLEYIYAYVDTTDREKAREVQRAGIETFCHTRQWYWSNEYPASTTLCRLQIDSPGGVKVKYPAFGTLYPVYFHPGDVLWHTEHRAPDSMGR